VCPTCHAKLHHAEKQFETRHDGSLLIWLAGQSFEATLNTESRLARLRGG
jgi:hypothetical protein